MLTRVEYKMKNHYSILNINPGLLFSALLISFLSFSCTNDVTDSLFDTVEKSGEPPVIESVYPVGQALSGVSEIEINGSNFSTVFEENLVTFGNGNVADILEATTTKLIVKAPLLSIPADSNGVMANLRVAVVGSELPSEIHSYRLLESVKELFVDENSPLQFYGICVDDNTDIYASAYTLTDRIYRGEYLLKKDGTVESFNQKDFTHFTSLKVGPDGVILGARADKVQAIFEIVQGAKPNVFVILPNGSQIIDFDTDASKRIWAGGIGGKIFSISYPEKEISEYEFTGTINALRVYIDGNQTYLYASAVREKAEKLYRMPISDAGTLGMEEEFFNISDLYGDGVATKAINFSIDGTMFIGNSGLNPVIMIHPDKTVENLYQNLLKADQFNPQALDELVSMSWGTGDDLYFVRKRTKEFKQSNEPFQNVVRVLTQKQTAAYYGRDL